MSFLLHVVEQDVHGKEYQKRTKGNNFLHKLKSTVFSHSFTWGRKQFRGVHCAVRNYFMAKNVKYSIYFETKNIQTAVTAALSKVCDGFQ